MYLNGAITTFLPREKKGEKCPQLCDWARHIWENFDWPINTGVSQSLEVLALSTQTRQDANNYAEREKMAKYAYSFLVRQVNKTDNFD